MRTRSVNHGQPANAFRPDNPDIQTGITCGGVYRSIEEAIDGIGAATGGAVSPLDFARWVGAQLLSRTGGEVLRGAERLPQVWGDAAQGYAQLRAPEEVHVRPHGKRPLSAEARERIAEAQRLRWARVRKHDQAQLALAQARRPAKHPPNWARMSRAEKGRWYYQQKHPAMSLVRSEATRAAWVERQKGGVPSKARRAAAAKGGKRHMMPQGFWQAEVTKLLKEPRPQIEVSRELYKRFPQKRLAISVMLATMKRQKQLVMVDNLLSLPPKVNGAATSA